MTRSLRSTVDGNAGMSRRLRAFTDPLSLLVQFELPTGRQAMREGSRSDAVSGSADPPVPFGAGPTRRNRVHGILHTTPIRWRPPYTTRR